MQKSRESINGRDKECWEKQSRESKAAWLEGMSNSFVGVDLGKGMGDDLRKYEGGANLR